MMKIWNQHVFEDYSSPKVHSVVFVIFILSLSIYCSIPIFQTIDDVATLSHITTPLFPQIVSRSLLGWIRCFIAAFIIVISAQKMSRVEYVSVNYLSSSKLISRPITLTGWRSQGSFTSWTWNILGIYFAMSGLVTLYVDDEFRSYHGKDYQQQQQLQEELELQLQPILRTCVVLFETVAPLTMLVSAVVRYALWPIGLKKNNTKALRNPLVLVQHNANIFFALCEVAFLGGLTVRWQDMALASLFGVVYILFAWSFRYRWIKFVVSSDGEGTAVNEPDAQFLYFFLDTTLEGYQPTLFLGMLFLVLIVFYCIFVIMDDILTYLDGGFLLHLLMITVICSCVCRFRD